jgi:signal transduction histidine kinase
VAIVLGGAAGLGWLGWRLLEQDRALERQRIQERLDVAADLAGAALVRLLAEQDDRLTGRLTTMATPSALQDPRPVDRADDISSVTFGPHSVLVSPRSAVRYYPIGPADGEAQARLFAPGEVFEFQQEAWAKAIAAFRELAHSPDPAIKAGALMRVGRNLHKSGQLAPALAAYAELAAVGPIPIAGVPADLLARHARCVLLEGTGDVATLGREARALYADLQGGRWQLARGSYLFYAEDARRWSAPGSDLRAREDDALALSGGVEWLWNEWQRVRDGNEPPAGRHSLWIRDRPVLVLWRSTSDRLVASVFGRTGLEGELGSVLAPVAARQKASITLTDAEDHVVLGHRPDLGDAPRRIAGDFSGMHLPWTVQTTSVDRAADLVLLGGQRRMLFAGFALTALLLATGGYFTARAVSRELVVARLQSDFVSTVSHEFRTPLATLRQSSELLADGRVQDEPRRQQYYEGMRSESERLSRLVENLLDFGRMDAGAREYRFEPLDSGALVNTVAAEFAERVRPLGYHVAIGEAAPLPEIRGDREALGRALWNLLDNAVKYSPDSKTIWVQASRDDNRIAIQVRDTGVGIGPDDQRQIFRKFVRASAAKAAGIKGTGLGLTMVRHIVSAHGGEVRLTSALGTGSSFTIVLPIAGAAS